MFDEFDLLRKTLSSANVRILLLSSMPAGITGSKEVSNVRILTLQVISMFYLEISRERVC